MRHVGQSVLALVLLLMTLGAPPPAAAQADDRPTSPTPIEAFYLTTTAPFRVQLEALQSQLTAYQQAAATGQIDTIPQSDLGYLSRELFNARQAFDTAIPSTRLDQYDRTIKLALDHGYEATVLLLRAQIADSAANRESLVRQAALFTASSGRLLQDAAAELRAVLPTVAQESPVSQ